MLIVVVIIGILVSSLIPRLTWAKDKTENARATKDVRDIATALDLYKMDNGNSYPVSVSCNGTVKTDCTLSGVYSQISKYLGNIPQGNTKLPQWTIGNGNIVPAWNTYGYIGTGQRYILSYQFIDTRDRQRYKAVRMPDERRWMASNLNYKTATWSYCYNDIDTNCNIYGRMYTRDDSQIACPPGWKLPSDGEWITMLNKVEDVYGGLQNHGTFEARKGSLAAKNLQSAIPWCQGTDTLWFSALPGGFWEWSYVWLNSYVVFRTSGKSGGNGLRPYFMCSMQPWINIGQNARTSRYSVRCIQ